MDSLCDPSTADIVGRVLEAFGLFLMLVVESCEKASPHVRGLMPRMRMACNRGILWLFQAQEQDGAWRGRWGVNCHYGTCYVLCGLAYFCCPDTEAKDVEPEGSSRSARALSVCDMVRQALTFVISVQNPDGGWGESLETYRSPDMSALSGSVITDLFSAPSTASQTAWALMALIAYLPTTHPAIQSGKQQLIQTQTESSLKSAKQQHPGPKPQRESAEDQEDTARLSRMRPSQSYTRTGFPNNFFLGNIFYSHYFLMMALKEFLRATRDELASNRSCLKL